MDSPSLVTKPVVAPQPPAGTAAPTLADLNPIATVQTVVHGGASYMRNPLTQIALGVGLVAGGIFAIHTALKSEDSSLAGVIVGTLATGVKSIPTGVIAGALWPLTLPATLAWAFGGRLNG